MTTNPISEPCRDEIEVFALQAAETLELRAKYAQSMIGAIPAICAEERQSQHCEFYAAEASENLRMANAIRTLIRERKPA